MNDQTQTGSERDGNCCCGPAANDHILFRPLPERGKIKTPAGDVVKISTEWRFKEYVGAVLVRIGFHRMNYAVRPGLYAVGNPDKNAPVLVSANYKLSFDVLRRELTGLNVWILVIDTKGVNVWCAAGKGTFGTMEIAKRVMATGLANVVSHRKLIVPQLGAPGVAAHIVQAFCDFSVVYGPVRARDIKAFLNAGMKADSSMRRVTFGILDRLSVSWLELFIALKPGLIGAAAIFIIMGISGKGFSAQAAWERSSFTIGLFVAAILSGTVLTAVLLPFLPGKAFSFKGGVMGAIIAVCIVLLHSAHISFNVSLIAPVLFTSAVSAYLALNFTGSSTYTSPSGVKKEIRFALPVIISLFLASGLFAVLGRIYQ